MPGGRTKRVHTALSSAEYDDFHKLFSSITASEFLRYLIKKAIREDTRYER